MRTRKIPSMSRTVGRMRRWDRRHKDLHLDPTLHDRATAILLEHKADSDQTDEECVGKLVEAGMAEDVARKYLAGAMS